MSLEETHGLWAGSDGRNGCRALYLFSLQRYFIQHDVIKFDPPGEWSRSHGKAENMKVYDGTYDSETKQFTL